MKKSRFILLAFLSVSLVFLSSCKDDPEDEISPYIGNYVVTKATLSEDLILQTNEIGPMTVMAGTDITPMIQSSLLGAIECEPANSFIELREDFSLYISCSVSMDEIDAGTWEEQDATTIILSMNSTAVPLSPTGIELTVTDVTLVGNLLTGTTTVPISKETLAGVVALMSQGNATLDMEATPPALPMTFTIELTKQ